MCGWMRSLLVVPINCMPQSARSLSLLPQYYHSTSTTGSILWYHHDTVRNTTPLPLSRLCRCRLQLYLHSIASSNVSTGISTGTLSNVGYHIQGILLYIYNGCSTSTTINGTSTVALTVRIFALSQRVDQNAKALPCA